MTIDRINTPDTVELSKNKLVYNIELAESTGSNRRAYQDITFTFPSATTQQFTFNIPDEDYSVQTVATSNFTTLMDDFINKIGEFEQLFRLLQAYLFEQVCFSKQISPSQKIIFLIVVFLAIMAG